MNRLYLNAMRLSLLIFINRISFNLMNTKLKHLRNCTIRYLAEKYSVYIIKNLMKIFNSNGAINSGVNWCSIHKSGIKALFYTLWSFFFMLSISFLSCKKKDNNAPVVKPPKPSAQSYRIVYFLTSGSDAVADFLQRRKEQAKQVTHVIYFSNVNISAAGQLQPLTVSQQNDWDALKQSAAENGFKAMYGFNKGMTDMRPFLEDSAKRKSLVTQLVTLQQTLGGAGIDFDIEYPASANDTKLLGVFLNDVRVAMGNSVLLTADVGPKGFTTSTLGHLEGEAINKSLDWINLMPYGAGQLNAFSTTQNIVNEYLGKQVSPQKIVIGLPYFAKSFYIDNNGVRQPFNPGYRYLVDRLTPGDLTTDSIPYTANGANPGYLKFNGPAAIQQKAAFAKAYGGVMAWHWRTDTTNQHSLTDAILRGKAN